MQCIIVMTVQVVTNEGAGGGGFSPAQVFTVYVRVCVCVCTVAIHVCNYHKLSLSALSMIKMLAASQFLWNTVLVQPPSTLQPAPHTV